MTLPDEEASMLLTHSPTRSQFFTFEDTSIFPNDENIIYHAEAATTLSLKSDTMLYISSLICI